jgi:hypothetical protein
VCGATLAYFYFGRILLLSTHVHSITTGESLMNTPLTFALAMLLVLIAVPATRELLRAFRADAAKKRLVPIRIETNRGERRSRDY